MSVRCLPDEMVSTREVGAPGLTCLADIVSSALPQEEQGPPRKIAEHGDGPSHKPHRNGRHSLVREGEESHKPHRNGRHSLVREERGEPQTTPQRTTPAGGREGEGRATNHTATDATRW